MCQLLAVETPDSSLDLDLVGETPLRIGGVLIAGGTPFTIRVPAPHAERDLIAGWADAAAIVMVLAGRHRRSSWVCLGVGPRRILVDGVVTTLSVHTAEPSPTDLTSSIGRSDAALAVASANYAATPSDDRTFARGRVLEPAERGR